MRVTVVDVQPEELEISGPSAVRYPENSTDPVASYSLLNADAPVDEWVISGADGDEFSIDANGELTFNSPPDFENKRDVAGENTYRVTITVYAVTQSKTEFVLVRVTDINEPPAFDEGETATREVELDAELNSLVGAEVTATDPDVGDYPSYSLPDTATLPFAISEYSGQLSVDGAIDANRASYSVVVLVTDNADADDNYDTTEDHRITVTINVADGGNNAPVFPAAAVSFSIKEDTATVENVGAPVVATDDDTGDTLSYILGGTDAGFFTIVSTSGQIQTKTGQNYDFETKSSYSVTVTADDSNGGTADKAVTITLTDVDEDGTVTLSSNQPTARAQVTATLADPDGVTGTTAWQWAKSNTAQGTYDNISGATSATYEPVDGDATYYLRATATYTDGFGANKTAEATTTSAVQAGTNRAPTFEYGLTTTRDVDEGTAEDQPVGSPVTATDADGDTLTYSLTGTDETSFTVDNTGQIKVCATTTLDYEAVKDNYTLIVRVHDNKNAIGTPDTTIDATIIVTINVTNMDEDGTVSLSMTQPSVRTEITATLTDPDGGVASESWQWAKADAQDGPYTDINGEISANYTPDDGDVSKFLKAKVSYTDAEASSKNAEAVSDTAVQAGANRPPTFSSGTVTLTVPENSGADVNVGSPVTATDLDAGNTLEYSLEGTDKDSFKIVSDSGQIQTKSGVTYDFETKASYSVTVKAGDGNSGTATKAVTIDLTDVDDAGTVALSMSQPVARTQLTATLTDQDSPVTSTTWVWAHSDAQVGTYTDISGATLATYTHADGDVGKFLKATASYTDSHGPGKTAVAVSANAVGSRANRAPDFGATNATREFPESRDPGLAVGIPVKATDADTNDVLDYTLEGTDASSFEIVPTDGQIKTKDGVTYDHEAKDNYSVTVKVEDKNGGTDTIDVTINVTDINEKPAFTVTAPVAFSIAENTSANTNIGSPVAATDPDDGDVLFYSLDTASAAIFDIDTSTGQLKTKADLDKET